jgi:hypothetical protein
VSTVVSVSASRRVDRRAAASISGTPVTDAASAKIAPTDPGAVHDRDEQRGLAAEVLEHHRLADPDPPRDLSGLPTLVAGLGEHRRSPPRGSTRGAFSRHPRY